LVSILGLSLLDHKFRAGALVGIDFSTANEKGFSMPRSQDFENRLKPLMKNIASSRRLISLPAGSGKNPWQRNGAMALSIVDATVYLS
jgi:hypothetical protein